MIYINIFEQPERLTCMYYFMNDFDVMENIQLCSEFELYTFCKPSLVDLPSEDKTFLVWSIYDWIMIG